ncbi:MAG TPA: hypothetical protein PKD37_03040 [Oligoflexia bacterium]|nr:hypothetical protein [Oligoflexia bacterium]HMP26943.1 hypothetical protein [Oligoflexia bacterium]
MGNSLLLTAFFFISTLTTLYTSSKLDIITRREGRVDDNKAEVLYLPSGRALELISFGYDHAVGNYLWFHLINYFGKHYNQDQYYPWFNHMCDLITQLNRSAKFIYEFCATMLSWEIGLPEESDKIINRGLDVYSNYWRFYYLRGMNAMLFLDDQEKAKDDFILASKQPYAPNFLARIAAKKIAELENFQVAIGFLSEMINNTNNELEKKALQEKLKQLVYDQGFVEIEKAQKFFEKSYGRKANSIRELRDAELIKGSITDPFGGTYYIDSQTFEVKSTSNLPRSKFLATGGMIDKKRSKSRK